MDPGKALLEKIEAKTGKTPKDFVTLAKEKGFDDPATKPAMIMAWLKGEEVGLGHGYAMALTHFIQKELGQK